MADQHASAGTASHDDGPVPSGAPGAGFRWDPAQYEVFADHRRRPFADLTARIGATHPRRVVDLGCGPGTMTETLARRWPEAEVVGLDSSQEMVDAANARPDRPANLRFATVDARAWSPEPDTDVLVTNAMLQWIPEHRELVRGWLADLPAGAWFAAQVPAQHRNPSHAELHRLAAEEPFAAVVSGERSTDTVAEPADYAGDLLAAGWEADVWETTYQQVMRGPDPVPAFTGATVAKPFVHALTAHDEAHGLTGTPEALAPRYRAAYAERMRAAYPRVPGTGEGDDAAVLFAFRRIFLVGHRPG
ncbi:methyltransferase domain-containing protein [Micrococcus lylae]|uniref:methyltransferase domain-containing protein n=1 Tax=Micrococcus lylae TaxID=1273 RepID=UPI003EC0B53A